MRSVERMTWRTRMNERFRQHGRPVHTGGSGRIASSLLLVMLLTIQATLAGAAGEGLTYTMPAPRMDRPQSAPPSNLQQVKRGSAPAQDCSRSAGSTCSKMPPIPPLKKK